MYRIDNWIFDAIWLLLISVYVEVLARSSPRRKTLCHWPHTKKSRQIMILIKGCWLFKWARNFSFAPENSKLSQMNVVNMCNICKHCLRNNLASLRTKRSIKSQKRHWNTKCTKTSRSSVTHVLCRPEKFVLYLSSFRWARPWVAVVGKVVAGFV